MRPPPPPGQPVETPIRQFFAATRGGPPGFCRKVVATVTLEPVAGPPQEPRPARPRTVGTGSMYRWPDGDGCEAYRGNFFSISDDLGERAFRAVRALAALRRAPGRLPISIDDQEARDMAEFLRGYPERARGTPRDRYVPITSGRVALLRFPIDRVSMVTPAARMYPEVLKPADLTGEPGHALEGVSLFAGGEWEVGLVLDGDRIKRVRILHANPPPF